MTVNGVSSEDQCIGANGGESSRHDSQSVAEVGGELLQLRPGDYSLVSDQDPSIGETQLHLLLHFCCKRELLSKSRSISSLSLSMYTVTSAKVKYLVNTNQFEVPKHYNTEYWYREIPE